MCVWGWFDVRQRGYSHPEDPLQHKTDFTVYTEAGAAFFDGRPPYEVSNPRGWTYLYPPLFAILMAPLHALPSQDQVMVWFIVSLILCWGCIYEFALTLRHIRSEDEHLSDRFTAWFPWLGLAAVFASTLPALNCLQRGQVGILKLYLLALGLRLVLCGRTNRLRFLGGIVLSLPVVLKVVPLLPVCFLVFVQFVVWLKGRRSRTCPATDSPRQVPHSSFGVTFLGLIVGLFLFFFVVPSALIGWETNWNHLKTWSGFVLTKVDDGGEDPRSGNSRSTRNQSLENAAYRLGNFIWHKAAGGPDDRLADFFERPREIFERPQMIMDSFQAGTILLVLRLLILAALGAVGIRLGVRGDALSIATAFGLACVTMLVVSPVARMHYFMLVAPAMLYLPLWLDRQNYAWTAKIMAVVPIVLVNLQYVFLSQAGRVGLLGLGTTLWLLTAFALIARGSAATAAASMPKPAALTSLSPATRQAA